jgi:AcrR family transcriptional regulator
MASSTAPRSLTRQALGDETRAALIAAATEVFIEDGFRAARVQDIAARAGQRLSAINYHFKGKEGLYLAVLRHHGEAAIAATPLLAPDGSLPQRERLEFAIRAFVTRVLGAGGHSLIGALMLRELANPTNALGVLVERFGKPQSELLRGLVAEILGAGPREEMVERAMLSIVGQCIAYRTGRPMIERLMPHLLEGDDLNERLVRHISEFSWAGLMALRAQRENPA